MKPLRRAFNLLLAVALMLALTIPAFAATGSPTDTDCSITIQNDNTNVSINGKTYDAYKIFSLSYNTGVDPKLYAYSVDDTCLSVTYNGKTGSALIESLTPDNVRDFADYVYNTYIKDQTIFSPIKTTSDPASGEVATINGLTPGYYLVYGTAKGADGTTDVVASVSLTTADPTATVKPKLSVPTLDKQIQHNELATEPDKGWGNVGDNQIGDTVNYRTITSVPDTNNYTSYTYVIHDTMTSGLTFNPDSVVVRIGENGTQLTKGTNYTVGTVGDGAADGDTFTVTFNDIKTIISSNNLTTSDHFYVTYDATLNKDAILYDAGHNDNTAYLEYSNNPYDNTGHGKTPPVTVYDWTFTMGVNKTDGKNTLSGAEFVLSKSETLTKDGSGNITNAIALIYNDSDKSYTIAPAGTTGTTTISAGSITIKGLDDSITYYLHETKAPDGYNLLTKPVEIKISASYNTPGSDLSDLLLNGAKVDKLSTEVVNKTGSQLPGTGGMGTTAFYAVGGTLAAGAGIMLIARKRVKNEK